MSRILIADDQNDVLEALRILLKGEGHQTDAVTSLAGVFQALEKKDYALLIMDLNYTRDTTSGQEGLEVIPKIQALDNTLPIVVMTAWATIDLAVDAMKRGARDFIPKPWDNERLLSIVRTQIDGRRKIIRDAAGIREKFGVSPQLIPDLLALVGDAADGYPGIPGIGAKTAAQLLNRHGQIEKFPPDVLGKQRDLALLFKKLATLRTDAPLFKKVETLRWRGATPAFAAWAKKMKAPRLLERCEKAAGG